MKSTLMMCLVMMAGVSSAQTANSGAATSNQGISVCGVDLHLGMDKSNALDRLGRNCTLWRLSPPPFDFWGAHGKEKTGRDLGTATILFINEKLASADQESVAVHGEATRSVLASLISAIEKEIPGKLEQSSEVIKATAWINASIQVETLGDLAKTLLIHIGGKTFKLDCVRLDDEGPVVVVSEAIP